MKSSELTWKTGALFICTKCGKSISKDLVQNQIDAAEDLKKYLKDKLKEKGLAKEIRVMTSSCLDICMPNAQAISYISNTVENFILNPEKDRDQILQFLVKKATKF